MNKDFLLKIMNFIWEKLPQGLKDKIFSLAWSFYEQRKRMSKRPNVENLEIVKTNRDIYKNLKIIENPFVSIIIPTKNKVEYLRRCLDAIEKNTFYKNYEVIIVDNNTYEKDALELLKEVKTKPEYKVLKYSYKFNFSKVNNFASKYAKGKYLVFLNNDTVPQKNWLRAMLSICQKKNVGIVGSKLLYPNGTIQHAGMIINENQDFFHIYRHAPFGHKEANKIREYPAVTGACMMIKKKLFEKIGKFDEDYWMECQDVDLCYKVRKLGYRVVYTPFSILFHTELVTRGPIKKVHEMHDRMLLKKKWFADYWIKNYKNPNKRKKILLIKLLTLGDTILITPTIEAIRKKYPKTEIHFAISKMYKDVIEGNHHIDKLYICKNYDKEEKDYLSYYDIVTRELLVKEDWDKTHQLQVLDLEEGYWGTNYHLKELYADLANVKLKNEKMFIPVSKKDKEHVDRIIKGFKRPIILIHTTSGWNLKDWDYDEYEKLVRELKKRYKAELIQIGSKNDYKIKNKNVKKFLNLTLKQTAALMKKADLLICPDSGPMHMASTVGLPIVALFGCTSPPTGGPAGDGSYICIQSDYCCDIPCHMRKCSTGGYCTKKIEGGKVLEAIEKMLNRKKEENIQETWWKGKVYPKLAREIFNGSGKGGFRV